MKTMSISGRTTISARADSVCTRQRPETRSVTRVHTEGAKRRTIVLGGEFVSAMHRETPKPAKRPLVQAGGAFRSERSGAGRKGGHMRLHYDRQRQCPAVGVWQVCGTCARETRAGQDWTRFRFRCFRDGHLELSAFRRPRVAGASEGPASSKQPTLGPPYTGP